MSRLVTLVIGLFLLTVKAALTQHANDCGKRMKNRALMIGGHYSEKGMWPWQVGIYKKVSGWRFICGGALIAPQWVLTAAHCFYVEKHDSFKSWSEKDTNPVHKYKVRAGDHETRSYESTEQERTPLEILIHPGYKYDRNHENDIALIKLNRKIILNRYVRTVCLPDTNEDLTKPGVAGTVAGWGMTESASQSFALRHSTHNIMNNSLCHRGSKLFLNETVTFCARDSKSVPCYGDSGGSIVRRVRLNGKRRWVTIGLVSWGGCALKSNYGYYTRVQPFMQWILHKTDSRCLDPGPPQNGIRTHTKKPYRKNDVVKFKCNAGYTRVGKSVLSCQQDGTWNGYKPICLASCSDPGIPRNGVRFGNAFKHGRTVRFRCKRGYKLIGKPFIICKEGKWDNSIPYCSAPCPNPGIPFNGKRHDHSFQHNDKVRFLCDAGWKMDGKHTITCKDGRWDHNTPKCILADYSACGESPTKLRTRRMVGGNRAGRGTWPWQVGIYINDTLRGNLRFKCGGTLIDKQWVLTVANCFYGYDVVMKRRGPVIIPAAKYTIKVGDYRLGRKDLDQEEMQADTIFIHRGYRDTDLENDIALVKLPKDVKLGAFVRTICLPNKDDKLLQPGKHGIVAGWGATQVLEVGDHLPKNKATSDFLLHSAFIIQNNSTCKSSTKYFFNPAVTFCAGDGKGGNDTCQGDAGGGFVRKVTRDGRYRWVTAGLVSWGEGCGLKNKYTFYTKVEPFMDWIKKTMNENKG